MVTSLHVTIVPPSRSLQFEDDQAAPVPRIRFLEDYFLKREETVIR